MTHREMAREASIDRACQEATILRGGMLLRLRPPPQGVPDRLLMMPGGRTVFIEFKTPTGQVRRGQLDFMAELTRLQVPWRIVRSVDEFTALLDKLERDHLTGRA